MLNKWNKWMSFKETGLISTALCCRVAGAQSAKTRATLLGHPINLLFHRQNGKCCLANKRFYSKHRSFWIILHSNINLNSPPILLKQRYWGPTAQSLLPTQCHHDRSGYPRPQVLSSKVWSGRCFLIVCGNKTTHTLYTTGSMMDASIICSIFDSLGESRWSGCGSREKSITATLDHCAWDAVGRYKD